LRAGNGRSSYGVLGGGVLGGDRCTGDLGVNSNNRGGVACLIGSKSIA